MWKADRRRDGIRAGVFGVSVFLILCGTAGKPEPWQVAASLIGFALLIVSCLTFSRSCCIISSRFRFPRDYPMKGIKARSEDPGRRCAEYLSVSAPAWGVTW